MALEASLSVLLGLRMSKYLSMLNGTSARDVSQENWKIH